MGLLTNNGAPNWHPAHQDIKDVCVQAQEYCKVRLVCKSNIFLVH